MGKVTVKRVPESIPAPGIQQPGISSTTVTMATDQLKALLEDAKNANEKEHGGSTVFPPQDGKFYVLPDEIAANSKGRIVMWQKAVKHSLAPMKVDTDARIVLFPSFTDAFSHFYKVYPARWMVPTYK